MYTHSKKSALCHAIQQVYPENKVALHPFGSMDVLCKNTISFFSILLVHIMFWGSPIIQIDVMILVKQLRVETATIKLQQGVVIVKTYEII